MLLLGVDEAGYGPNMGPLVVGLSVWRVPSDCDGDLYRLLSDVATAAPRQATDEGLLAVADSKSLYHGGTGLHLLEQGVLALCGASGDVPESWRAAWQLLAEESWPPAEPLPWHDGYDVPLPRSAAARDVTALAARFRDGCTGAGVEPLGLFCRAVFPDEFNRLVAQLGNKSHVLTHVTLDLVQQVLARFADDDATITCDKHGGRNFYAAAVQPLAGDQLLQVIVESAAESRYRFSRGGRRVEIGFYPSGEQRLPVAAASMAAKYLRELAMQAFNAFWQRQLPQLRPTAGYPADARRFQREIAPLQAQLAIPSHILWRCR